VPCELRIPEAAPASDSRPSRRNYIEARGELRANLMGNHRFEAGAAIVLNLRAGSSGSKFDGKSLNLASVSLPLLNSLPLLYNPDQRSRLRPPYSEPWSRGAQGFNLTGEHRFEAGAAIVLLNLRTAWR
jgi:hypothetical protein